MDSGKEYPQSSCIVLRGIYFLFDIKIIVLNPKSRAKMKHKTNSLSYSFYPYLPKKTTEFYTSKTLILYSTIGSHSQRYED